MSIFHWLEQTLHVPAVFSSALFAALALIVAGIGVRRAVANGGGVLADEGMSIRNVLEVVVEFLMDLAEELMGEHARRYFPIVGTIFLFVLISNLMGLVPGLSGSTSDINTTVAWALISFVVYNYVGIKKHRWKYIYQFMGPSLMEAKIGGRYYHIRLLTPIFFPLEIVLHFARIVTLAIRLLANMFADHTVVVIWVGLVPLVIPAVFMGLGLFVAFLQAYVFSLLTMIYIGLALEEPH